MNEIVNLQDLATQINTEHELCQSAMKASFEHALKVGELLIEAKSLVDHGEWLPWVEKNCAFSERTARAYMRVTRHMPELTKTAAVADLTLRGALQMLEAPKEPVPQPDLVLDYQNKDIYPDDTEEYMSMLNDFQRRLEEANTFEEAWELEKEISKYALAYKMRYIEGVWEFGRELNELEKSDDFSPEMLDEMGVNPRHARRAKALATVPGGELLQYFSSVEELPEKSKWGFELTLLQVLYDFGLVGL